jgi:hypothetical protein
MNLKMFEDFHLSEAIFEPYVTKAIGNRLTFSAQPFLKYWQARILWQPRKPEPARPRRFACRCSTCFSAAKATAYAPLCLLLLESLHCKSTPACARMGRYLPLRTSVVLGGVSVNGQVNDLRKRPDILVATPGRLLDLMRQRHLRLDHIEFLVLDEADRMLDMGFIHDVRSIVSHIPAARQTLLFSATLSSEIAGLASDMLRNPVSVTTTPPATVPVKVDQKVLFVDQANKGSLLVDILQGKDVQRALVFTRTKHRADRVMRHLSRSGISADAIHSNRSQNGRQRSLAAFDNGRIRVLGGHGYHGAWNRC